MGSTEAVVWPREGYSPDWLALEDAMGGRYQMTGNFAADVPTYDAIFAAMSKQWPQFEDELEVLDETTDSTCQDTNVRIYKPKSSNNGDVPLMIYIHGGGFIAGNLDTEDAQCRYFAAKTPCLVISVDYPKLTQPGVNFDVLINKFGIPVVRWCQQRASSLGFSSSQTILAGGSAGAMFASQIIHSYCIEREDKNSIVGAVLWYPCVLPPSYVENGKYKEMYTSWPTYINGKVPVIREQIVNQIWPLYQSRDDYPGHYVGKAKNLSNWPPTYMVNAEKDIFRDDGHIFHRLLDEAGVPNKLDFYDDLPHWFHFFPALNAAHTMLEKSLEGIRFVLDSAKNRA